MKRLLLLSFLISLFAFNAKAQGLNCIENSIIVVGQVCPPVADTVWGCDGNCYPNPCEALFHNGVTHFTHDPCNVLPQQCHADFIVSDFGGTYNFIDSSFGSGVGSVSYVYEFGDGDTSHNANPSHVYAASGYYLVCLTINDPVCTSTSCRYILAQGGTGCNAMFTAVTNCGITTFIDQSTGSYDSCGWDFGPAQLSNQGPGNQTYQYTATGDYVVHFNIYDNAGLCNSAYTDTITISSLFNLTSSFTYTATGVGPPYPVVFNNSSSGGAISYYWDFADGTTDTTQNPTHNFANCGNDVTLTCYDINGCQKDTIIHIDACNIGIPTYTSVLNSISVYPNPAKDNINVILFSRMTSDVMLTVKDVTGRNVIESKPLHLNAGKNNYQLQLPLLPAGVYMVQINDEIGMMNTRVLIK